MSANRSKSIAASVAGKMTASVVVAGGPQQPFKTAASSYLDDTRLHVYGLIKVSSERTDVIYLWIPRGIADGEYPIENVNANSVVAAALSYEGVGPIVTSGKISIEWDRTGNRFKAGFEFLASSEGKDYEVIDGTVDVAVSTSITHSGGIKATIAPPLFGNNGAFQADEWRFELSGTSAMLLATQRVGESTQGILLRIPEDYESGEPTGDWTVFLIYNHGLYAGEDLAVPDFTWDRAQKRLEASFTFHAEIAGVVHKVQNGKIALKY